MKMSEVCFNNHYLFDLAYNKKVCELFKKM